MVFEDKEIYISGTRKLSKPLKKMLKRRSVIEPMIGHMKNDGKLGKNYLKGVIGDNVSAVLSAVAHNIRLILNAIVFLYLFLIQLFFENSKNNRQWTGDLAWQKIKNSIIQGGLCNQIDMLQL